MRSERALVLVLLVASLCGLSACQAVPPSWNKGWSQLQEEVRALQIVLTGGSSPLAQKKREEADRELQLGLVAQRAKENAELLQEMYRVVMLVSPSDKKHQFEFAGLVNSLNQGASLEGVYNGMTHSDAFRRLEVGSGPASAAALKAFSETIAELQGALPAPTRFDASSAEPLAVINSGEERPGADSPAPGGASALGTDAAAVLKLFTGASVFTLKRVAGDEALKVVAARSVSRTDAASWYSRWAVRMSGLHVDFGLQLRNKPDEKFHLDTALKFGPDRLRWEVLNRIHRVLNHMDGRR